MREERQEPEPAESQAESGDQARLGQASRADSIAEPGTQSKQEERGRRVSGMDEYDGGDRKRGSDGNPTPTFDPADERERHEGQ